MFKRKTVFVIGAGASKDLGFPLGTDLREQISKLLSTFSTSDSLSESARLLYYSFQAHSQKVNGGRVDLEPYIKAAKRIAQQLPLVRSIDEFIDHHAGDIQIEFVAKAAICQTILQGERGSSLLRHSERHSELNTVGMQKNDAWLTQLWFLMREGTKADSPTSPFENLSFIVFNYDRALEVFFIEAIKGMFGVEEPAAWDLLRQVNIIHPYGTVGQILSSSGMIPYGSTSNHNLVMQAEGIRTFGESGRDSEMMKTLNGWMSSADQVITIGFAFHDQNMEFLSRNKSTGNLRVYGTAYDEPDEVIEDCIAAVAKTTGAQRGDVALRKMRGAELLRTYGKRLTR